MIKFHELILKKHRFSAIFVTSMSMKKLYCEFLDPLFFHHHNNNHNRQRHMNIPRELIYIHEPIMNDPYGRLVLVFRRTDIGKDIFVTKVTINEVIYYVSFPVEIQPGTMISGNTTFHIFNSLPRSFRLAEDNFSNSGVIVLQERPDSFLLQNRVLVELIGE